MAMNFRNMPFGDVDYTIDDLLHIIRVLTGERDQARAERDRLQFEELKMRQLNKQLTEQSRDKDEHINKIGRAYAELQAENAAYKQMNLQSAAASRTGTNYGTNSTQPNKFSQSFPVGPGAGSDYSDFLRGPNYGSLRKRSQMPVFDNKTVSANRPVSPFDIAAPGGIVVSQAKKTDAPHPFVTLRQDVFGQSQRLPFELRHGQNNQSLRAPVDVPSGVRPQPSKEMLQLAHSAGMELPPPEDERPSRKLSLGIMPTALMKSRQGESALAMRRQNVPPAIDTESPFNLPDPKNLKLITYNGGAEEADELEAGTKMRSVFGSSVPLSPAFPEFHENELARRSFGYPLLSDSSAIGDTVDNLSKNMFKLIDGWVKKYCTVVLTSLPTATPNDIARWAFLRRCALPLFDSQADRWISSFCKGSNIDRVSFITRIIVQYVFETVVDWKTFLDFSTETDKILNEIGDKPMSVYLQVDERRKWFSKRSQVIAEIAKKPQLESFKTYRVKELLKGLRSLLSPFISDDSTTKQDAGRDIASPIKTAFDLALHSLMDPKGYFLGDLESVGVGMEFEDRSMTNIKADAFRDAIWSTSIRLGVTPAIRWQPIEETYGAQSLLVSKAGVLLYSEKELHESLN